MSDFQLWLTVWAVILAGLFGFAFWNETQKNDQPEPVPVVRCVEPTPV